MHESHPISIYLVNQVFGLDKAKQQHLPSDKLACKTNAVRAIPSALAQPIVGWNLLLWVVRLDDLLCKNLQLPLKQELEDPLSVLRFQRTYSGHCRVNQLFVIFRSHICLRLAFVSGK
mmetsp:Transcript_13980/g.24733  ORF Transcript_13980/g.24733 Transcript_13980/m.24733 type:complete len:118 (+) Transcript_13980:914-1267(+)